MDDDGRLRRFVENLRAAGDQFAEARRAYSDAKRAALADLPQDDRGRAKIVCRRYAERRAVALDDAGRPDCFDPDHTDCQGCVEDVRDGIVETW
jgi:hypothetical protein